MSKLSTLAAKSLVILAGAGSLLFAATSVAASADSGPVQGEVSVVADSPWDK